MFPLEVSRELQSSCWPQDHSLLSLVPGWRLNPKPVHERGRWREASVPSRLCRAARDLASPECVIERERERERKRKRDSRGGETEYRRKREKDGAGDFPDGAVIKTLISQCKEIFQPWMGN